MSVNYNYKKGIDSPSWEWLPLFPQGASNPGTSQVYDGKRYMYWTIQYGTTATTASTTQLWRFDTWTFGWQFLSTVTSGNQGIDMEYDSIRNVIYITIGAGLTAWQVFNLNTTAVTICGQSCPAFNLTTITTVLPILASFGASLTMPSDDAVPAVIDSATADPTGQTTTVLNATSATGTFGQGMVNLQVTVLTGAQAGVKRTISAVSSATSLTVTPAMPGALASGDTFQVEQVNDVATATTTTTLTDATSNWTVNAYANMDVILTSGTLAGQRRRIASNTATVLTLATAVTGNPRTGPFSSAPGATDAYKIVPSSDFLYYQPGNSGQQFYKIDVVANPAATWVTLTNTPATFGGGANTFYPAQYAPYQIMGFRGTASAAYYLYNVGTNAWTTPTVYPGGETFSTGANSCIIPGKRKLMIQKEGTTRLYILDLLTGVYEPAGTVPYSTPGTQDGKRIRVITTPDGAQFLYGMRAGGQELFRVPLEWL